MESDNIQQMLQSIPQSMFAKFITHLSEYDAGNLQLQIQTHHDQNSLNQLLKGILEQTIDHQTVSKVRFDFLVQGKLLRGKIKSHLIRYQLSCEDVLKIEYFLAFEQMDKTEQNPEEDWISSISEVMGAEENIGVIIGMYNGSAAFYEKAGKKPSKNRIKLDVDPIKAVKCLPSNEENIYYVIGGGLGQQIVTSTFSLSGGMNKISQNEHHGTILALDVNPSLNGYFCSVGNSGSINVWKIPEDFLEQPYNEVKKKQKKKQTSMKVLSSVASQKIHDSQINSVCWITNTEIITGSSDHLMKVFDVEKMGVLQTIKTKDSITTGIDYSHQSIITSHEDGYIRLWDLRNPLSPASTYKSHSKLASCVRFSQNTHIFGSGAYDQTVKIWDSRSVFPLQTLHTEYEKVFCLGWKSNKEVICGGSNPSLTFHSL